MKVVCFDPKADLLYVRGHLWGPRAEREVRLVLDTACGVTLIRPEITDALGYSVRDAEKVTAVSSPIGEETGYLLGVSRLRALGHEVRDLRVNVCDLPEDVEFEGLLGLNFLPFRF